MPPSRTTRANEVLMKRNVIQPRSLLDISPDTSKMCRRCLETLQVTGNIFSTVVDEVINYETCRSTLSVEIKHQAAPVDDGLPQYYEGRTGWQSILTVYDHGRSEYAANVGVTAVVNFKPHTEICKYSVISIDIAQPANGHQWYAFMMQRLRVSIALFIRQFVGPGKAHIQQRVGPDLVERIFTIMRGEGTPNIKAPRFQVTQGWILKAPWEVVEDPEEWDTYMYWQLQEPKNDFVKLIPRDKDGQPISPDRKSIPIQIESTAGTPPNEATRSKK